MLNPFKRKEEEPPKKKIGLGTKVAAGAAALGTVGAGLYGAKKLGLIGKGAKKAAETVAKKSKPVKLKQTVGGVTARNSQGKKVVGLKKQTKPEKPITGMGDPFDDAKLTPPPAPFPTGAKSVRKPTTKALPAAGQSSSEAMKKAQADAAEAARNEARRQQNLKEIRRRRAENKLESAAEVKRNRDEPNYFKSEIKPLEAGASGLSKKQQNSLRVLSRQMEIADAAGQMSPERMKARATGKTGRDIENKEQIAKIERILNRRGAQTPRRAKLRENLQKQLQDYKDDDANMRMVRERVKRDMQTYGRRRGEATKKGGVGSEGAFRFSSGIFFMSDMAYFSSL